MEYEAVIGLEVHAELSTQTKIYCNCKNSFGLEVNSQVCPICMGMPGTLPKLNENVVNYAIKMGQSLHCNINNVCRMDRKNYFYPDLPKAYQISQSDVPLCENGYLDVLVDDKVKRIGVTRIHIEEDAGKLLHNEAFAGSLVDLNRCGVPLIEIVSEPDMRSSAEAKAYLETIKLTLMYLGISDCKMQEGSIRCDVNVSVREKGSDKFGTRTEMKNVNSFSAAQRGIDYEIERQIKVLESGGNINQETRRWDDVNGENKPLRSKEDAHDYRYFPEPDMLTIVVPKEKVKDIKNSLPKLPSDKLIHYVSDLGLNTAEAFLMAENEDKAKMLDECVAIGKCSSRSIFNWITGDISRYMNETGKSIFDTKLTPEKLCELIAVIESGMISNNSGKIVFEELLESDNDIKTIIEQKGLSQISDKTALYDIANQVINDNQKSVDDYKGGKTNALGFLVGQCMKASKGKANPGLMKEIILELIG